MTKMWEYSILPFDEEDIKELNIEGKGGWEAVTVFRNKRGSRFVLLKREIQFLDFLQFG